jgi:hypothetical protein
MKMAQGYVTDDGTFFESQKEATLHEAESHLRAQLVRVNPELDGDKFLAIVFEVRSQLGSYLDAYNAATATKRDQPAEDEDRGETDKDRPPEVDASLGHVSSTEEDLASLLKLPTRGPSHVPNVGSGPHAEKVSKRRTKHGVGGG